MRHTTKPKHTLWKGALARSLWNTNNTTNERVTPLPLPRKLSRLYPHPTAPRTNSTLLTNPSYHVTLRIQEDGALPLGFVLIWAKIHVGPRRIQLRSMLHLLLTFYLILCVCIIYFQSQLFLVKKQKAHGGFEALPLEINNAKFLICVLFRRFETRHFFFFFFPVFFFFFFFCSAGIRLP
jgi:hypothetical protein